MPFTTSARAMRRVSPIVASTLLFAAAACSESTAPAVGETQTEPSAGLNLCTRCVSEMGKILFMTDRDGNLEIYKVNADGTMKVRLTNNPAADKQPSWSNDYKKIAFVSNRDGNDEIYTMNATGTGVLRLTNNAGVDNSPVVSPDGKKIAFMSNRDGDNEIFVMNADGTGVMQLTQSAGDDMDPTWSPDGTKIAFASNRRGGKFDIWIMSATNGSGLYNFTPDAEQQMTPHWSPDGQRIAYYQAGSPEAHQIFWQTMTQNGVWRKIVAVGNNGMFVGHPSWSPDGQAIAFMMQTAEGFTFTMTSAFNQPMNTWYEMPGLFNNGQPAWTR